MTTPVASRRSRRRRAWIVAAVVVIVALPIVAEAAARIIAPQVIRDGIVESLDLPPDTRIDVDIPSALLLPLLVVGQLPELRLHGEDVVFEGITADVDVTAQDVPMYREADWSGAYATLVLGEGEVRTLLSRVDGFPSDAFALDPPEIALDTAFEVFGTEIPVGVGLSAAVADGDLLLSPTEFRIAGRDVSADAIRQQVGPLAGSLLEDWPVCLAGSLPSALTLTGVAIEDRGVVASFEIDSAILHDAAAQRPGSCADAS